MARSASSPHSKCCAASKESNLELNWPIGLVATSEEEGRFGGMLCAQASAGDLTPEFILNAHDADGSKLTDAMRRHLRRL